MVILLQMYFYFPYIKQATHYSLPASPSVNELFRFSCLLAWSPLGVFKQWGGLYPFPLVHSKFKVPLPIIISRWFLKHLIYMSHFSVYLIISQFWFIYQNGKMFHKINKFIACLVFMLTDCCSVLVYFSVIMDLEKTHNINITAGVDLVDATMPKNV